MNIQPPLVAMRGFSTLNTRDLFICFEYDEPCLAMKGVDSGPSGGDLMLLLGPKLPSGMGRAPRIVAGRPGNVLYLGDEIVLKLTGNPDNWSTQPPPNDVPCVCVSGDKTYFRANWGAFANQVRLGFVDVATAVLAYELPWGGGIAYTTAWEMAFPGTAISERLIFSAP